MSIRSITDRFPPVVGALLGVLLLAGCTTAPESRRLLDAPPTDLPPRFELTETPFHPQRDYQCGPAALATLLGATGFEVDAETLVDEVYLPGRRGSLQTEMVAALRARGRLAIAITPGVEALLRELAVGRPVLVLQNLGLESAPVWHYAVVVGYDLAAGEVVLRSGETRRRVTPLPLFEQSWSRGGRWGIVALDGGQLPVVAEPLPLLRQLEGQAAFNPARVRDSYRAVTGRWPDEPLGWLLLGNADYAAADYMAAADAFREALLLDPSRVAGWNNLAYTEAALGCGGTARAALDCALRISPDDSNTLSSRDELAARFGRQGDDCRSVECPVVTPP